MNIQTVFNIASILGYIGFLFLFIQVTFGSRHIFKYFTNDTVFINKIHKQFGIWGIILVFAHPILETVIKGKDIFWLFIPDFSSETGEHISFGRLAVILFLVIYITSAVVRNKIKWRPWKYLHHLTYIIFILVLFHVPEIGSLFDEYLFIKILWGTIFLLFIITSIIRLIALSGISKMKYTISKKTFTGNTIMILTIKPISDRKVFANIGQHFFLQMERFQSEHPFSIMEQNKETGELTFGIRKLGKTWDRLLAKNIGDRIFVDGPYGVFTKEAQNNEEKVLISGGIGVTPFVDLVSNFGDSIIYINCNKSVDDIVRRDVLIRSKKYVDILEEGKESNGVMVGRIDINLIKKVIGENYTNKKYFICGSPAFVLFLKDVLAASGIKKENIYFEELGF